ncbi:DUF6894 family protein [Methylobacterium planeticum]|uniref:DUF6894 domain-containing protein n=1 Tax=Methylobacterium planeticum TaxID=2615211 RepID=A0A6N6MMV8_9HYPH|nr:hypothetical protein [Methylobacterium planeticum]KAB1071211.1 hypothetical protein F6X51_20190 [Methylobacterium planeticum]
MSLYFFDVHDGTHRFDDSGTECTSLEQARLQAKRLLPDLVREQADGDQERHTYTVLVTDADHRPVYSATLSFTGLWLIR